MSLTVWIILGVIAWLALSVIFAVLLGRYLRSRNYDEQYPLAEPERPDDDGHGRPQA